MTRTPHALQVVKNQTDAIIYIYDEIGPGWLGMVDAIAINQALIQVGDVEAIAVRINSPGGDVFEAAAIFNLLREHPARITVKVDGVAASAASIITMVGDEIQIAQNAMIMIHEAWTIAVGNKRDLAKTVGLLEKVDATMIDTYVERTGNDAAKIRSWVEAETWFTSDEAIANGFADKKTGTVDGVKMQVPKGRFKNAPTSLATYDPSSPIVTLAKPPARPGRQDPAATGYQPGVIAARCAAARARMIHA